MDDNEIPESASLLTSDERNEVKDVSIKRRLQIQRDHGEHSLHLVVVIEDLRAAFYITFIAIILFGIALTKAFTKEDYTRILVPVYGITSMCSYFDFAPSTYVLPVIWCFGVILGFLYNAAAVLRIQIAYLEKKLTRCAYVSLILAHVYVALSIICFMISFAVQPNPTTPETMVVHTVPYVNLKIMFCVFQVAVVYFGVKVSWVGLNLPRWFHIASIVHLVPLVFVKIFGAVWIINALGDMGEKNLEGKGLWWSVRNDASKISGTVIGNISGLVMGILFPLLQSLFICRKGVNSHALTIAVSDNRVSAFA